MDHGGTSRCAADNRGSGLEEQVIGRKRQNSGRSEGVDSEPVPEAHVEEEEEEAAAEGGGRDEGEQRDLGNHGPRRKID